MGEAGSLAASPGPGAQPPPCEPETQGPGLLCLPMEILLLIIDNLPKRSQPSVRLACRKLEAATEPAMTRLCVCVEAQPRAPETHPIFRTDRQIGAQVQAHAPDGRAQHASTSTGASQLAPVPGPSLPVAPQPPGWAPFVQELHLSLRTDPQPEPFDPELQPGAQRQAAGVPEGVHPDDVVMVAAGAPAAVAAAAVAAAAPPAPQPPQQQQQQQHDAAVAWAQQLYDQIHELLHQAAQDPGNLAAGHQALMEQVEVVLAAAAAGLPPPAPPVLPGLEAAAAAAAAAAEAAPAPLAPPPPQAAPEPAEVAAGGGAGMAPGGAVAVAAAAGLLDLIAQAQQQQDEHEQQQQQEQQLMGQVATQQDAAAAAGPSRPTAAAAAAAAPLAPLSPAQAEAALSARLGALTHNLMPYLRRLRVLSLDAVPRGCMAAAGDVAAAARGVTELRVGRVDPPEAAEPPPAFPPPPQAAAPPPPGGGGGGGGLLFGLFADLLPHQHHAHHHHHHALAMQQLLVPDLPEAGLALVQVDEPFEEELDELHLGGNGDNGNGNGNGHDDNGNGDVDGEEQEAQQQEEGGDLMAVDDEALGPPPPPPTAPDGGGDSGRPGEAAAGPGPGPGSQARWSAAAQERGARGDEQEADEAHEEEEEEEERAGLFSRMPFMRYRRAAGRNWGLRFGLGGLGTAAVAPEAAPAAPGAAQGAADGAGLSQAGAAAGAFAGPGPSGGAGLAAAERRASDGGGAAATAEGAAGPSGSAASGSGGGPSGTATRGTADDVAAAAVAGPSGSGTMAGAAAGSGGGASAASAAGDDRMEVVDNDHGTPDFLLLEEQNNPANGGGSDGGAAAVAAPADGGGGGAAAAAADGGGAAADGSGDLNGDVDAEDDGGEGDRAFWSRVASLPQLRSLVLRGGELRSGDMEGLVALTGLQQLVVNHVVNTHPGLACLASLSGLTRLVIEDLQYVGGAIHDEFCGLSRLTGLRSLSFLVVGPLPAEVMAWGALTQLTQLEITNHYDDNLLPCFSAVLPRLAALRSLNLSNFDINNLLLAALRRCTALSCLQMGRFNLSAPCGDVMPGVRQLHLGFVDDLQHTEVPLVAVFPHLDELSLSTRYVLSHDSAQRIPRELLVTGAGQRPLQVTRLHLYDALMSPVVPLAVPSLISLRLDWNQTDTSVLLGYMGQWGGSLSSLAWINCDAMQNEGLETMVGAMSRLTELELVRCVGVTDGGMAALSALTSLTSLIVAGAHQLSAAAFSPLVSALPALERLVLRDMGHLAPEDVDELERRGRRGGRFLVELKP